MGKCHSYEEFLIAGVLNQNLELVKEALDLEADINFRSETLGLSALMTGAMLNQLPIIEFLVNQGADILLKSQDGKMAVDYAIMAKDFFDSACKYSNKLIRNQFGTNSFNQENNEIVIKLLANKTVDADPNLVYKYRNYVSSSQKDSYDEYMTKGEFNM